jgi:hypothetical protein
MIGVNAPKVVREVGNESKYLWRSSHFEKVDSPYSGISNQLTNHIAEVLAHARSVEVEGGWFGSLAYLITTEQFHHLPQIHVSSRKAVEVLDSA